MPDYIKLCMNTWKFNYTVLNYENLNKYTDLQVTNQLKRFTLPQIADCVRVHVLRDQGGYWLDADTIMITGELPTTNMIVNSSDRTQTIGYLYSEPNSKMFTEWAKYQDSVVRNPNASHRWSVMGNDFTDEYVKTHPDITICPVDYCWPETYMITKDIPRYEKYQKFYFECSCTLHDLLPTNMLMLHNSWTPNWYKKLSADEVLNQKCTLSNILKETLM